jgi:hypothetical protein
VHQDHPGVNQIEGPFGQRIAGDVVAARLDVVERERVEKLRVDVGDRDPSLRTDTFSEPPRDRPATPADFQTVPAGPDAAVLKMALRGRVEQGGQGREASRGVPHRIHGRTLQAG